jgi:hypothetical protein
MAADSFWMAHLETRYFEFWAFGETKAHAMEVMKKTWAQHKRNRPGATYTWAELKGDVGVDEYHAGRGYADKSETYREPPKGSMSWMEADRRMKAMNKAERTKKSDGK